MLMRKKSHPCFCCVHNGIDQGIMQQGRPGAGLVALQLDINWVLLVQRGPRVTAAPPCN